ncbi:hypothetical protein GQ53DRAFT_741578 [Thozetella sp. PMI_491]|nr:hypothetical protein GQ53DRAFT_741578 [Thozetella sp. PMI_491]
MSSSVTNQELDSFREQWRAEVRARHPTQPPQSPSQSAPAGPSEQPSASLLPPSGTSEPPRTADPARRPAWHDRDDDYVQARSFDEDAPAAPTNKNADESETAKGKEPVTALEHYEKAVEKEAIGSLGESLRLYRKAFRIDDTVDQKYRAKHFPKSWAPKPAQSSQVSTSATAADAAPKAGAPDTQQMTINELIGSFSGLRIEPARPEIAGMPEPPCPISELPDELLIHILRDVAVLDVGDFVRLARVCKRFAFLVATEDRIWRRVCLGDEFGFGGMYYQWRRQITWGPLTTEDILAEAPEDYLDSFPLTLEERSERHTEEGLAKTLALYNSLYNSSWQRMFRLRPRIRFNGCYICTVNYIRAGQATAQLRWDSPVHIVTYYRYLRFFRDGTVISLLTTSEPGDVVHYMTRELLDQHKGGAMAHLPSVVMQAGLKGRWMLTSALDNPEVAINEAEGDLVIETEGASKRHIYRMDLSLRSAGKGTRNNKLSWRGFYSYNHLTDDWAEFGLKNGKPYFFSRVKSYGVGI